MKCTEVRFSSFLSGEFTTMAVINPPERKLAKHNSVQWVILDPPPTSFWVNPMKSSQIFLDSKDWLKF